MASQFQHDLFDRANGTLATGNWSTASLSSSNDHAVIASDQVQGNSGVDCSSLYSGVTWGVAQFSSVQVIASTNSSGQPGAICRGIAATQGYAIMPASGYGHITVGGYCYWALHKATGSGWSLITYFGYVLTNPGDTVGLAVWEDPASGHTLLQGFLNGVALNTTPYDHTSSPFTTAGKPGIACNCSSAGTDITLDNFYAWSGTSLGDLFTRTAFNNSTSPHVTPKIDAFGRSPRVGSRVGTDLAYGNIFTTARVPRGQIYPRQ